MNNLHINKIVDFSYVDGPGNRLVLFLQGCNFNCQYCHNPETIPERKAKSYTVEETFNYIIKRKDYIAGVTASGGECTLQWEPLMKLFAKLKEQTQLTTFIDTNGNVCDKKMDALLGYTDGFMIDLKAVNYDTHKRITGKGNEQVIKTIKKAVKHNKLYELRYVLIPEINDSKNDLKDLANFIKYLNAETYLMLIPYRNQGVVGEFKSLPSMTEDQYNRILKTMYSLGLEKIIKKRNFFCKN
ncbi:radical SAM protein [Proteinivorax tanatarense]|uniref:Radical SAM protein n=1 Tax=Proteinivorax tanatarense TaxID=1260629 RepID=A0AAU7VJB6_9FIRM